MDYLLQQILSGATIGLVYASLALALVLVYRGTGILNFAQGEIATFSTFLAWTCLAAGLPWWATLPLVIAASLLAGIGIERLLIRPVEDQPHLSIVVVTLALLLGVNAANGLIWGYQPKTLPSQFSEGALPVAGAIVTFHQLGMALTLLAVLLLTYLFFRFTNLGLRMRAAAQNPLSSRLLGISVGRTMAIGWGLAAVLGALAGVLSVPLTGLDPNVMSGVLLFSFAAAAFGGFESMLGAVIGGLVVGISQNLGATYIGAIGRDLDLVIPFGIIILVLLVRPTGLLGRASAARV